MLFSAATLRTGTILNPSINVSPTQSPNGVPDALSYWISLAEAWIILVS